MELWNHGVMESWGLRAPIPRGRGQPLHPSHDKKVARISLACHLYVVCVIQMSDRKSINGWVKAVGRLNRLW